MCRFFFRKKTRLMIVGCGDTGTELLRQRSVQQRNLNIITTNTSTQSHAALRALHARPLIADLDNPNSLKRLRAIAQKIVVLAPPPTDTKQDTRSRHLMLTLKRPHQRACACLRSGIHPATNTSPSYYTHSRHRHALVYVSTSGVYGDAQGRLLSETALTHAQSARAKRRVCAEKTWRKLGQPITTSLFNSTQYAWQVHILRAPGIYGAQRLPIARIQAQLPRLIATEDVYTNHIAVEDLAMISWIALWRGKPQRITHACDNQTLKMGDYLDQIADFMKLPRPPALNAKQVRERVTPMMWSFMQESRRLSNQRLRQELKVKLRIPTLQIGLQTWFNIGTPADIKARDT